MSTVGPGLPPLSPTREEFRALAGQGNLIPVFAELAADLDTPLSAFLRLRPGPYAFLLESVEGGEKWARYSFLGSDPLMVFTAKGKRISVRRADGTIELLPGSDPFKALRDLLAQFKPVPVPGLPRFQGGAVGFLSYDMIRHVERLPTLTTDDQKLPDAVFMFTDTLLVFDNLRHRLLVIANAHITEDRSASLDRAYDAAAVKIGMLLGQPAAAGPLPRPAHPAAGGAAGGPGGRGIHLDDGRGRLHGRRAPGEGVHRRRRRLPGRAVAPPRHRAAGRPVHGLSRAPHGQPVALSLLPAPGQDQHRGLVSGGAGAARG